MRGRGRDGGLPLREPLPRAPRGAPFEIYIYIGREGPSRPPIFHPPYYFSRQVFIESHPFSPSLEARAHGRADIIMLIVQTALVLTVQTFSNFLQLWMLLAILGVAGALWLGTYLLWLPHYAFSMNAANIIGATVYMWAFVCLCLNNTYPRGDAGVMLFAGTPFAAFAGYSLATWRATGIV